MRICYIPLLFACCRLMRAEEFSKNILDLDDKMRFAGIMEKSGHLHARCKKEGCEEYLNVKDRGISFSQIANIVEMRKRFSSDLGDLRYIVYTYDKIKIFSIPLMDHIVVLSTEFMCAAIDCVVKKVRPQILHTYSSTRSKRELSTDISNILYVKHFIKLLRPP